MQSIMWGRRGFVAVRLVDFNLSVAWIDMKDQEYKHFAKPVHAFAHSRDEIKIFNGNCVLFSIIEKESQRSVFFGANKTGEEDADGGGSMTIIRSILCISVF